MMPPPDSAPSGQQVLGQLAACCAEVTGAADADAVGARQAVYVAAPASTSEAAALLAQSATLGLTIVPRGSGRRLHWGADPVSCDLIVDTRNLGSVVEHAAGDLVVTVQAGVQLNELGKILAAAGQRLALDPPGGGSVGGIVATGAAGPLRFRYGTPRDLLIGMTVVRADGATARSGGKVVKNVAGYDLGKLFAGSYGTLGLITEATFRLHPLPDAAATVTAQCPDSASAAAVVQAMAISALVPSAVELDWPSAAAPITVSALLEGSAESVADRVTRMRARLGSLATAAAGPGQPGGARTGAGQPAGTGRDAGTAIRVAFWTGQLPAVLAAVRGAAAGLDLDPAISGSAAVGVLQAELPPQAAADHVARFVAAVRAGLADLPAPDYQAPPSAASAVVLYAPRDVRAAVDIWGPVPSAQLMRAVKDQFDPGHRMAPGRFAGGI